MMPNRGITLLSPSLLPVAARGTYSNNTPTFDAGEQLQSHRIPM